MCFFYVIIIIGDGMKKGFTLIELLAVIIILGIIALIAIPTISKILEEARIESFRTTAKNIAKATETECNKNVILNKDGENYTFTNGKVNGNLEISGELPKRGYSESDSNCNVGLSITNGTYRADKTYLSEEIIITKCDDTGNCNYNNQMVEDDPLRHCYTFNSSTKTIEKYDRENCPLDVVIPETIDGVEVENIGDYAFMLVDHFSCHNGTQYVDVNEPIPGQSCIVYPVEDSEGNTPYRINSIVIPRNIKKIGTMAFANNNLSSINIPNKVTTLNSYSFYDNQLTDVYIPDNVTSVGGSSFAYNQITNMRLSQNMTTIPYSFLYSNPITSFTVPSHISSIKDYAFASTNLQELIIEEGVKELGSFACDYCTLLKKLRLPSTLTKIGANPFMGVTITDGPEFIYARNNDGTENKSTLYSYVGQSTNITLPNETKVIGSYAFYDKNVTSITFNNGLQKIGGLAFCGTDVTQFDLPSTVNTIEYYALRKWFNSNPNLTKIINRTGKSFDWANIVDDNVNKPQEFVTGTVRTRYGDVSVTSE